MLNFLKPCVTAAGLLIALSTVAAAEPISLEAVMEPKDSIRMDFGDGSKRFVLMVRREGTADGDSALAGASVSEFGWHDINPPVDGDPHGYLQFTTSGGDIANIKFTVRAVFMKGDDQRKLVDYGFWELVSGTGQFKDMTGVGTLTIKPATGEARLFTLDGEIGARP